MDVSNAPEDQGVMLAFLPSSADWCKQDLPHLTLVYAGTIDMLSSSDASSLAKDAAMLAMLTRPFGLRVSGLSVFGDTDKVDVLTFNSTPELLAARRTVERWNASQHSFNPHITIGPANQFVDIRDYPVIVSFDRIIAAWGEESLIFNLNTKY